ncbi:MAG: 50S ribosomal protein L20 [Blastocatellia bacterium]|nr:50S ribosomal protein L20 [Blastocatellia bacterium]
MPRAKRGNKRLQKRKDLQKLASGYRGTKSKLYRSMRESVQRALKFAYVGRKLKKREYRSLWIVRIGAATRLNGMNYSQFMHGLKAADINLDRKLLADIAVNDPKAFSELVSLAKKALGQAATSTPQAAATAAQPAAAIKAAAPVETTATATTEAEPSDLIDVEGIGPAYLAKLAAVGITSRTQLLRKDAEGRQALAEAAGIGEGLLAKWVSQVELAGLEGVSDQDAEILVAGGITSVQALAEAHPDILNGSLIAINAEKNLVKEVASVEQIKGWIEQAKAL